MFVYMKLALFWINLFRMDTLATIVVHIGLQLLNDNVLTTNFIRAKLMNVLSVFVLESNKETVQKQNAKLPI